MSDAGDLYRLPSNLPEGCIMPDTNVDTTGPTVPYRSAIRSDRGGPSHGRRGGLIANRRYRAPTGGGLAVGSEPASARNDQFGRDTHPAIRSTWSWSP
jgi:hypothetical protein